MKLTPTFTLAGYGAGGTPGATYELVISSGDSEQRIPVTSGGTFEFERVFGRVSFWMATTFADGTVREGNKVFSMDLPEETETPVEGSPYDRAELASVEVVLDDGSVVEGVWE